MFVTLGLFALLDWDESRLSSDALLDAWPPATRLLAIVYVGMVALPIHFWRTRVHRFAKARLGAFLARCVEILVCVLIGVPVAGALAFGIEWTLDQAIDATPEAALGPALVLSLAGFAWAMVWRVRRGGFIQRTAR